MKPFRINLILLSFLFLLACKGQEEVSDSNKVSVPEAEPVKAAFPERNFSYWERELEYLMVIWPGEYDNVEQLDFDRYQKKQGTENGGHLRIHNFTEKVDLPNFGNYVLYVEENKNDSPTDIHRQAIYHLEADGTANGIRIEVYHFKNPTATLSENKDLSFLKKLQPHSSILKKGCDLLLQREGMAFEGKRMIKDCTPSTNSANQFIDYQIRISENEFWFQEKIRDGKTKQALEDEFQTSPHQLEKTRCFVCMIDFPREEGGRPVKTEHYIKIHDQGGKFEFDYMDGRHMVLGMRNTWSLGMQRETFVIFIQEGSQKGPTLIYSWGNPGADRIGFNPGWIRVQCDLDNPRNVKLQQELRPDS